MTTKMTNQQIQLAKLSRMNPIERENNPQLQYLYIILNALDKHYDDLEDLKNIETSLECALALVKSDINSIS